MSINPISNQIYGQESCSSAHCARLACQEWLGREPRATKPNCMEGRNWKFGPRNSNHDFFFLFPSLPLSLPAVFSLLKSVSRAVCLFECCARLIHCVSSEYTSRREFGQSFNMDFPSHSTFRVCNQPICHPPPLKSTNLQRDAYKNSCCDTNWWEKKGGGGIL